MTKMAIFDWVVSQAAPIAKKKILDIFVGDVLFNELTKTAQDWCNKLPDEVRLLSIESLLAATRHGPSDNHFERARRVLDKLAAYDIPTVEDWEEDLFTQWELVRQTQPERAPFFEIEPETAKHHINSLAQSLHTVCKLSRPHFQSALIDMVSNMASTLAGMQATQESLDQRHSHDSQFAVSGTLNREKGFVDAAPDIANQLRIAVEALESDQPDVAISHLSALRYEHWRSLTPRDRYRLVANLGFAHLAKENIKSAGDHLTEAVRYQPNDERARVNEVMGYALLKNTEKAQKLAEAVVTDFPQSDLAHASMIRNSPKSASFSVIETNVPLALRSGLETSHALATRALQSDLLDTAEEYARKALRHDSSLAAFHETLGYVLLQKTRMASLSVLSTELPNSEVKRLNEAATCFQTALKNTPDSQKQRIASLRYHLGCVQFLRRNKVESEAHLRFAYETEPSDPDYVRQYACTLIERSDSPAALQILRQWYSQDSSCRNHLILADILLSSESDNDLQEAGRILDSLIGNLGEVLTSYRLDAVTMRISLARIQTSGPSALDIVNSIPAGCLPKHDEYLLLATANRLAGNQSEVEINLAKSKDSLPNDATYIEKRRIAVEFCVAGLTEKSFEMWKEIISPVTNHKDITAVVSLAVKCEDYGFILDFCRQLRENKVYLRDVIHTEINVLQMFHCIPTAFAVMNEMLGVLPNDDFRKELQVRLSHLSLVSSNSDDCDFDHADLPSFTTISPELGLAIVELLIRGPNRIDGVKYAYKLVRQHFDSHLAHRAVIISFFFRIDKVVELPTHESVVPGSAISFLEDGCLNPKWCVIEDVEVPDRKLSEYGPTDALPRKLLGKKVGDQFQLSSGGLMARTATVQEIISKYAYRLRNSMENWQRDFPDHSFLYQFQIPREVDGAISSDYFHKILNEFQKQLLELEEGYKSEVVSATMFARSLDWTALEAVIHCANKSELPVRCSDGTQSVYNAGLAVLGSGNSLIVDSTSVATLFLTEGWELLRLVPLEKYISIGTMQDLRSLLRKCKSRGGGHQFVTKCGKSHFAVGVDVVTREMAVERLENLMDAVVSTCRLVEGYPLAKLDPELRDQLIEGVGRPAAETLAIAKEQGMTVWTDDLWVGRLSIHEVSRPKVSSDVVSRWCVEENLITQESRDRFVLQLIRMGYTGVPLRESVILLAGTEDEWIVNGMSIQACISWLRREKLESPAVVQAAFHLMCAAYENAGTEVLKLGIISEVWEALGRRHDRFWVRNSLRNQIEKFGNIDVSIRVGVLSVINDWQRLRPM